MFNIQEIEKREYKGKGQKQGKITFRVLKEKRDKQK
jgi:hypothetical protein